MINQDILTPTYFYLQYSILDFQTFLTKNTKNTARFLRAVKKAPEYLQAQALLQKFVEHKKFMMAMPLFYARNFIFCVSD